MWAPESAVPDHIKQLLVPSGDNSNIDYILAFFQIVRLLKTQPRTGWVDHGIPNPETISDHMYRMSIMAMCIPNEKIDISKCVKVALVHDIAETLVGDITPFGGVDKEEKSRREYETVKYLSKIIEPYNAWFSKELVELWLDYEEIRTIEARYVKDIDKFEMIEQAWEYEQEHGPSHNLDQFYRAQSSIKTDEIKALCAALIEKREAWLKLQN